MADIRDIRGVRKLMFALIQSPGDSETYGTPFEPAGVEEIGQELASASVTKYYSNRAAIVVASEGSDTYTLTVSAADLETQAKLLGKKYVTASTASGSAHPAMMLSVPGNRPYLGMMYIYKDTDGNEWIRSVMKTKVSSGGGTVAHTEDDGTDSNGLEYTLESVYSGRPYTLAGNDYVKYFDTPYSLALETKMGENFLTPDNLTDNLTDNQTDNQT